MNAYRGPRMTLGNAAKASVRLIVWCSECGRQVGLEPAALAARYGAERTVIDRQGAALKPCRVVMPQCQGSI